MLVIKVRYPDVILDVTKETNINMNIAFSLQVSAEAASQFGELIADPDTKELLHYTEKPETFVIIC